MQFNFQECASHVDKCSQFVMQSSPPLGSYRNSRAYRNFKNPPQPHMCIQTTIECGKKIYINVLSWTRIVIPQEPSDPIPLYGGMQIISGVNRSPQLIFAVMANPEVLKYSGRHSQDPAEHRAIIELMCDFVEAMNPDLKLARNGFILNDRDITGELKDIWNAVQIQRFREREEQICQQNRQQTGDATSVKYFSKSWNASSTNNKFTLDQLEKVDERLVYSITNEKFKSKFCSQHFNIINSMTEENNEKAHSSMEDFSNNAQNHNEKEINVKCFQKAEPKEKMVSKSDGESKNNLIDLEDNHMENSSDKRHSSEVSTKESVLCQFKILEVSNKKKKEKFVGFLPHSSIFPRLKNKHKNKEKDKDKTLLNALKKSKEKKIRSNEKIYTSKNENELMPHVEKNGLDFENELQKLDLNKLDITTNNKTFL